MFSCPDLHAASLRSSALLSRSRLSESHQGWGADLGCSAGLTCRHRCGAERGRREGAREEERGARRELSTAPGMVTAHVEQDRRCCRPSPSEQGRAEPRFPPQRARPRHPASFPPAQPPVREVTPVSHWLAGGQDLPFDLFMH